jgi:hypothetical protein
MKGLASSRRIGIGLVFLLTLVGSAETAKAAPILTEDFDDIAALTGSGWSLINNSSPGGATGWFQGNTGVFGADSGAGDSYIAANFLGADYGGTISEWLITPELTLNNGDLLTFSARTDIAFFADQLEVRMSTSGASGNVGATATSVGDFSALLLTLNPLDETGWSEYTVAISGLVGPTSSRLAFRYFVDDTSANGSYIGIDGVSVDSNPVPEPSTLALLGTGMLAGVRSWRKRKARPA